MKKNVLVFTFFIMLVGVFVGCQGPQRQQGYISCLDIAMLSSLSSEKNIESAADKAMQTCEPLFDEYTNSLAKDYMRMKGWNRLNPHAYTLFKQDASADIRKKLIENYGE